MLPSDASVPSSPGALRLPGRFVVVEGGEGSGKSTLISGLADLARAAGAPVTVTAEPGGSDLGVHLRRLLLDAAASPSPRAELLLFLADRAEHVERVVLPALAAGDLVLCDRFSFSTFAYQADELGLDDLLLLDTWARQGLVPDLTLLLPVPPGVGLARVAARGPSDRFEARDPSFHQRVFERYLGLADRLAWPTRVVAPDEGPSDLLPSVLGRG